MSREKILDYFTEKYRDFPFILDSIKEQTTEDLECNYNRWLARDKKESNILENGTVTYTIDFNYDAGKEVEKYMWDNNMFTMFNGEIKYSFSNDGRLLGVPIEFVEDMKKRFELKLSRKMYILGRNDLNILKVGDKVRITTNGIFGNSDSKGTVCDIEEDCIIIRKYRSRTKGYTLNVGDECCIEKIKSFQKVS